MNKGLLGKLNLRACVNTRWKIALVSVSALFALLVIVWLVLTLAAQAAVNREFAKIRAKGEPVTPAELAPPPIPDEENVAVALELAFAELDAAREKLGTEYPDSRVDYVDPADPDFVEKSQRAAELTAPAVELARKALERPRCQYDLDFTAGAGMLLSHLSKLRSLARVLGIHARCHAEEGKPEQATQNIIAILALARTLDDEPIIISKLVTFAMIGIAVEAIRDVERSTEFSSQMCLDLITALRGFDFTAMMPQAMIGDRVLLLATIRMVVAGRTREWDWAHPPPAWNPWLITFFRFHYLRDEAALLGQMAERIEASAVPPWEARDSFPPPRMPDICLNPPFGTPFSFVAESDQGYSRMTRTLALRDAAVLGLSCELHRSAHGSYPDSLAALVPEFLPELPPDPFTGKSFVYRRTDEGQGFVVYSVGENLTDDGGVFRQWKDGDIPWEGGTPRGN